MESKYDFRRAEKEMQDLWSKEEIYRFDERRLILRLQPLAETNTSVISSPILRQKLLPGLKE
ncbi:MAG: hypothetical protein K0S61_2305 [Anaerocolumna sp.]|nr:hypothetical protein [Anaerocolumna sp.]